MTTIDPDRDPADFVAHRSPALLRTAYLLCGGDRGAAEDLPKDVLERVHLRRRRVAGRFEPYARAALANTAANRRRRPAAASPRPRWPTTTPAARARRTPSPTATRWPAPCATCSKPG